MRRKVDIGLSALIGILLLLALHTRGELLRPNLLSLLLYLIPVYVLLEWIRRRRASASIEQVGVTSSVPVLVLLVCAVVYLFSSGVDHGWFYFLQWLPAPDKPFDIESGVVRFVLLTALLWPAFLFRKLRPSVITCAALLFTQVTALILFITVTGGEPLWRYDHPSFMFRIHEFAQTYPQLINYVPHWNGGSLGYITTVSGTTGLGVFLWPLWRLFPVQQIYTYALAFLFLVVVPLMVVGSLRLMGARWTAGYCSGLMALGVSMHFYLWLLNYGTVGSSFALCFIVPFSACLYRVVWLGKTDVWLGVLLVLSAFFLIQWPPGVIMASPFVISYLISYRRWTKRKWVFLAVCGFVVFLLYARTIWLFMSFGSGHMDEVLAAEGESAQRFTVTFEALARGVDHIRAHIREGHPLVVLLGLAGAFVVPYRSIRRWYVPLVLVLAFAAGWGKEFFPKLQISRMAVPLLFAGVVPAGIAASRILHCRRPSASLAHAMLVAVLLLGGVNVARIYANENVRTHYVTPSARVNEIVECIRENTSEDARVLFAGPAIHVYGGGQVAALALMAEREMFCCDYYSFPPDTTDYHMPPRRFHKPPEELLEYMDMYNITHILSHHEKWKKRLRRRPGYHEVAQFRNISMFQVHRESSGMFYKGEGRVVAGFNRITIALDEPQDDIVLCYNWVDGFFVPEPVEIYPYEAMHGVKLLGVRPNGEDLITLRFKRWF